MAYQRGGGVEPNTATKEQTFSGTVGGSDNLFTVTGSVEIYGIYGEVTTATNGHVGDLNLEFDDGATSVDLTTATSVNDLSATSLVYKQNANTLVPKVLSTAAAAIGEQPSGIYSGASPLVSFILLAKNGSTNNITSDYAGDGTTASGVIKWYVRWKALIPGSTLVVA